MRALLCMLLLIAGCTPSPEARRLDAIDTALARAAAFLITQQDADGQWRSETYGLYTDGPTLTPHVLSTLIVLAPQQDATRRGLRALATYVDEGGEPVTTLRHPVYTAAGAAWSLALAGDRDTAARFTALLADHQLNETHGFPIDHPGFGGWSYAVTPPRADASGRWPTVDVNISATVFALGGLRFVNGIDAAQARDVLRFIDRCATGDGGYVFSPVDASRNKAGLDEQGRPRAYGTATADALRALRVCGVPPDDARVITASRWLAERFDGLTVPGDFNPDRAALREGYRFYYAWSVSHAFDHAAAPDTAPAGWAARLADDLLACQRDDGAWVNAYTDGRENDPLVATPLAAAALRVCAEALRR